MNYIKNAWNIVDNYVLARLQNRASTAAFWYLPEPPNITNQDDLLQYQNTKVCPLYLLDYRQKLNYSLTNSEGIIVLPYHAPIGQQINPEAAFQYALGLHDQFYLTQNEAYLERFKHYVDYFLNKQTNAGLWEYQFDWYGSTSPWHSALAQTRGAAVMLRAFLHSRDSVYLDAAKNALRQLWVPTTEGGFLHPFSRTKCFYFEEYPKNPTAVLNGFMSSIMNLWEMKYWIGENWLTELWELGIDSLEQMLPYYSNGWWSLYDLDDKTPIENVNSPRYHLLEIHYLQILTVLSNSTILSSHLDERVRQYHNRLLNLRALGLKTIRKIIYK